MTVDPNVIYRGAVVPLVIFVLLHEVSIADTFSDPAPFDVLFDADEMIKVHSELGIEPNDPNFLLIQGRYTDRGGRRTGDVIEVYPRPVHKMDRMCVMEPQFISGWTPNIGFGRFRRNVYHQRHIWWAATPEECLGITFEDNFGERGPDLITDAEIDLATTFSVHEMEEQLFSAVRKFAGFSGSEKGERLEVLMLFDAEDYDADADVCTTVFRGITEVIYQICLAASEDGLGITSVDYFVHKYEKSQE